MEPSQISGRDIIFRAQHQQSWRDSMADYRRAVEDAQHCLCEMKKANSKWGYHYAKAVFKEFPSGLDSGYKNVFLSCQNAATIESEESVIVSQVAGRILREFVIRRVVNENERKAVLKFLQTKVKPEKPRHISELYPRRLRKLFNKLKTGTMKSPENKKIYQLLKEDIDEKLGEVSAAIVTVVEVFLEQLKERQRIDLVSLKEEVLWGKSKFAHVKKLFSWIEDVTQLQRYTPAVEQQVVMQLIMNPTKYPGIVGILKNDLLPSKKFAKRIELKKFFAAWGILLVAACPTVNRFNAIYEEYRARKQELDRRTGCVSLEMQRLHPITLELCNAFLTLGGRMPIAALPKV